MNGEETIFPRRDIYVGDVQNAHHLHIHSMSIDCSGPPLIFGEISVLDLNKMLSCVSGFLPTNIAKINIFLQSMLIWNIISSKLKFCNFEPSEYIITITFSNFEINSKKSGTCCEIFKQT